MDSSGTSDQLDEAARVSKLRIGVDVFTTRQIAEDGAGVPTNGRTMGYQGSRPTTSTPRHCYTNVRYGLYGESLSLSNRCVLP